MITEQENLTLFILIKLLKVHGLRFSSVAAIKRKHITAEGHILVLDVKGDYFFIVYFPDVLRIPFLHELDSEDQVFQITYKQFFSICQREGFYISDKERYDNDSVTHYFRTLYINEMKTYFSAEFEKLRFLAGHSSTRSNEYYLRRQKNGTTNSRYFRSRFGKS